MSSSGSSAAAAAASSDASFGAASELAAGVLSQGDYGVGGFAPDLAARPRRTPGTQVESDVTPFGDLLRGHAGEPTA